MSYLPFVLQYYVGRIVLLQENRSNNKSLQMFQTLYAFGGCLADYAGMGLHKAYLQLFLPVQLSYWHLLLLEQVTSKQSLV